jgi:hypothetical protein
MKHQVSSSDYQRCVDSHPDATLDMPPIVARGAPMRNVAACSSCHGTTDAKLGTPWLDGRSAVYIKAQLQAFAAGTRRNDISEADAKHRPANDTRGDRRSCTLLFEPSLIFCRLEMNRKRRLYPASPNLHQAQISTGLSYGDERITAHKTILSTAPWYDTCLGSVGVIAHRRSSGPPMPFTIRASKDGRSKTSLACRTGRAWASTARSTATDKALTLVLCRLCCVAGQICGCPCSFAPRAAERAIPLFAFEKMPQGL